MYDFESGDLSLDFANTKDWHGSENPVENLKDFAALVSWGEQAGLITPEFARQLLKGEAEKPLEAKRSYELAIQVREVIYRIFTHLYAGNPIPVEDLTLLNSIVQRAMAHLRLSMNGERFQWEWAPEIDGANRILWPVIRSAAELLTSDKALKVRECEDDRGCGYLFVDQSKNHSRRWCSMESCGNRAKARRHYSRIQAG